jgi:hypothetical protein
MAVGLSAPHTGRSLLPRNIILFLHTRPLVRKGAPQKQDRKFQTATFRQEVISGHKSRKGARYQDILTD